MFDASDYVPDVPCDASCTTDAATRVTGRVVLTFSCGWCSADDAVSAPASQTSGTAYGAVADDGHRHAADIGHAFRHVGWCTVCGGTDGDHADGCPGDPHAPLCTRCTGDDTPDGHDPIDCPFR